MYGPARSKIYRAENAHYRPLRITEFLHICVLKESYLEQGLL